MKKQLLLQKHPGTPETAGLYKEKRFYLHRGLMLLLLWAALQAQAQQKAITGKISAKDNSLPLRGVTIAGKGSKVVAQSDSTGRFYIQVPAHVNLISASYVGYVTQEMEIKTNEEMSILLMPDTKELTDVVVSSGYGTQKKKEFTGAASQIGGDALENKPAQSFTQLLGGQAAGVDIVQPTGALNNPPVMRIRGINSISSNIYPLVIVDGVTLFTGSAGGAVGNDPLSDINPADIETIDILKDASATAIYGSRAANGVMVITTKKGKKGRAKVNYDGWVGLSRPYNLPEMLDAYEYVMLKNEARVNAGLAPGFALQTLSDGTTVNTNWYDVAYETAFSHSHNINIGGANEATSYFFSVGYSDQNGCVPIY